MIFPGTFSVAYHKSIYIINQTVWNFCCFVVLLFWYPTIPDQKNIIKPRPVPESSSKNSKDSKGMPFWPKPDGSLLKDLKADLGFGGGVDGGRMSFQ